MAFGLMGVSAQDGQVMVGAALNAKTKYKLFYNVLINRPKAF